MIHLVTLHFLHLAFFLSLSLAKPHHNYPDSFGLGIFTTDCVLLWSLCILVEACTHHTLGINLHFVHCELLRCES